MKKNNLLTGLVLTAMLLIFSTAASAQEKPKTMTHPSNMKEMMDSTKSHKMMMHNHKEMSDSVKHGSKMNHDMMHNQKEMSDSVKHGSKMNHDMMHDMKKEKESIVREGIIDLSKIDMNKDGKVFQDQMCWNVISDEAGRCPQCNMKLKEVTLEQAKEKLTVNGYKTKN